MEILDDLTAQSRLDQSQMILSLRDLPRQCAAAWQEAKALQLPESYRNIEKIVVAGVGGSAIAGDYLRQLLAEGSQTPVFSHRDYGLPPYVDSRTLVIISSYSGNTEEALSAFMAVLPSEARVVAVTGGGQVRSLAEQEDIPRFIINYSSPPRAALGYSLAPFLAIAEKVGVLTGADAMVAEAVAVMTRQLKRIGEDVPLADNPAKRVAQMLYGKLPVIYGADIMREVVRRWKTQLNETAKVWAFTELLPEANHNALASYRLPVAVTKSAAVVLIKPAGLHPRIEKRCEFTEQALSEAHVEHETVEALPGCTLAQMMSMTLFGDFVSYYLALLNGVDPTEIAMIDRLKQSLQPRAGREVQG